MMTEPLLFQFDPDPLTVTVPPADEPNPISTPVVEKLPPFVTDTEPFPEFPTRSPFVVVQLEPAPLIVTMPLEPPNTPTMLEKPAVLLLLSVPPFWTVSVPAPFSPIQSWLLVVMVE